MMMNHSLHDFVPALKSDIVQGLCAGALIGAVALGIGIPYLKYHRAQVTAVQPARLQSADFAGQTPSPDARNIANWVATSGDNAGLDFFIIDKKQATLYVFDANAKLRSSTPVLVGSAVGDDSVPGIGTKPIPEVLPEERTTPAGRYAGQLGRNTLNEDVVWIDYGVAVSMHRVRTTNPAEHRLDRLATPTIDDNRISYGCVNMPPAFYEQYVEPVFSKHRAMIYVLPDVKPLEEVFPGYAASHAQASTG